MVFGLGRKKKTKKRTTKRKTKRKSTRSKTKSRSRKTKRRTKKKTKRRSTKKKAFGGYKIKPDENLAKIIGNKPVSPSEMTKKLWTYIKRRRLASK